MGIRAIVPAPNWSDTHHRGEAKCREDQPTREKDLFFEDAGLALSVCNGTHDGQVCPRRTECLRVAMLNREVYGIWGGMTATDRLAMRMRHPGRPERWIWHPPVQTDPPRPEEN
ncbi:WhiB family transcriptional regulator [Streptomyces sp. NPDC056500]|uniref:WhiB family transcriptional regulator n=1 Tax=Streptomyces sp. NPDC056500 TaxID=3345840 RepID=UPI0036A9E341